MADRKIGRLERLHVSNQRTSYEALYMSHLLSSNLPKKDLNKRKSHKYEIHGCKQD